MSICLGYEARHKKSSPNFVLKNPKNGVRLHTCYTFLFVEETSGANVYIDKEYTGIDDNALCVIHGKVEQVDIAKEMIHEKLQQYNSANTFPIMDSSGSLIEHGSPPSDTRSDGSTGITYSSPVGPGSSNRHRLE